jgi:pimeloyl-[acyl-carrier protein] methyl ester esterase
MNLHVETQGQGEPMVMLHGWGMHGGLWGDTAMQLAQDFEVHSVDLPGHGKSHLKEWGGKDEFTLGSIVAALSRQFAEPVNVCGWSLGGMIAQYWAACDPWKVRRLVLVASTPCFAERQDWPFGMPRDMLQQFADELEKNFSTTLRRFLALQVRGSEGERELLAVLRERLFSRGEPDLAALQGGLDILRDIDLREALPRIVQPALVIAGQRDRLTPPQASHYLAQAMPDARVVEIERAAHAPFLSHPHIFVEHLKSFLHE